MAQLPGFHPAIGRYGRNAVRLIFEQTVRALFSLSTIHGSRFRRVITGVSFSVWRLPLTSTPAWRLNRK